MLRHWSQLVPLICQLTFEDIKPTLPTYYSHNRVQARSRGREVSWTLTKKLDAFAGPGEIKRREVLLDPQISPEEINSREVELGL